MSGVFGCGCYVWLLPCSRTNSSIGECPGCGCTCAAGLTVEEGVRGVGVGVRVLLSLSIKQD